MEGQGRVVAEAKPNHRRALNSWVRALELTAPIGDNPARTLPVVIDALAARHGDAPALLDRDGGLSFADLATAANRWARWGLSAGLAGGGTVALLMPNCPAYLAIWVGITRIGGVVALINTNLSGSALAHCIATARPKHIIVADELAPALASTDLAQATPCWSHGHDPNGLPRIDLAVSSLSGEALRADEQPPVTIADRALLIYTSGTTGLPKAAAVSHGRVMHWSHWFAGLMEAGPADRMYNCLPMYHSIGGVVATVAPLLGGGSVFLAPKFSASRFWDEVADNGCTLFQYIGELCRYLVNAPAHPRERQHRLRLACGNGLRGDIWRPFAERFAIARVLEYYAATEANFSLYNCEGEPGAIGRIPPFLTHRFKVEIVRFDPDAAIPIRGADGLCIRCAADESGEAISRIGTDAAGFEGYTDEGATEKKILRNVFAAGDAWYRSGDLMRRDAKGFFWFVDRIGDTFRWKGENVSTAEVASSLLAAPGVLEATVYGVAIPGAEGRAGMAALVTGDGFDPATLHSHLAQTLPAYARPLLVRLLPVLESTATFRPLKHALAQQGFDPAEIADPLLLADPERRTFVPLDAQLHRRLVGGELRL